MDQALERELRSSSSMFMSPIWLFIFARLLSCRLCGPYLLLGPILGCVGKRLGDPFEATLLALGMSFWSRPTFDDGALTVKRQLARH